MSQDHSPSPPDGSPGISWLRAEYWFLVICLLFVGGFWIWFFFWRMPMADADKDAIQGRAIREILAACNAALLADDRVQPFQPGDIATRKGPPADGVSPFVSILEVSRDGRVCHWDGISPARVIPSGARFH